ncbi:MAG: non-canonical purine NTP pyrophosphatase [Hydrotalea sp.]|nr:non-canonical purine NTP pyrophosphatase [Hydrotalea sp.]
MPKKTLIIATHNQGKVREFKELFKELWCDDIDVSAAGDYAIPEPIETGATFIANAELKTAAVRDWFLHYDKNNLPDFILADDSGLSVAALNGAPGIFSARWAGADKNFHYAMERIKQELLAKNIAAAALSSPNVAAYFTCALALFARVNNKILSVEGLADGFLQFPPRGDHGFGYDPIFVPREEMTGAGGNPPRSFAMMANNEKEKISHRTRAMNLLLARCKEEKIDFTP